jgi:DMSO/TMAO reductase YedYZ molybdopterin-dependent catalytic subunit
MRSRKSAASGPDTATKSRARTPTLVVRTFTPNRIWTAATVTSRISLRAMFRSRAERKVEEAGYDPARLPPGQYLTEKWPVLHAGTVPQTDLATWDLRVFGEVENPITLSWEELTALPTREIVTDIHCVTRWSRFDTSFKGVHWSELAKLVQPKPTARFVVAHAEQDFTANVPLSALEEEEALLAYEADGEPLTPEHGWPLRLVIPKRYFWKSAKWLRGIELLDHDEPGFWERLGYHNEADFWKEERYGF